MTNFSPDHPKTRKGYFAGKAIENAVYMDHRNLPQRRNAQHKRVRVSFYYPDINENDGESLYPRASNNAFSLAVKLANADTGKLSSLDTLLSSPFFGGSVTYLLNILKFFIPKQESIQMSISRHSDELKEIFETIPGSDSDLLSRSRQVTITCIINSQYCLTHK